MKKRFLLVAFLSVFGCLKAEQPTNVNVHKSEGFMPYHDFRMGIGAVLFEDFDMSIMYFDPISHEKIINFNTITSYRGMVNTNGIITANYTYHATSWLGVGVSASYVSFFNNIYDAESDMKIGTGIRNRIALYPLVRITWSRKRNVQLYSEAGFGLGALIDSETITGTEIPNVSRFMSGQFTLLGVSFGKKLYLYSNLLAVGDGGYCGLGLGYHFNLKK